MSRKSLIRSVENPYHVTARVDNREVFPLALDKIWEIQSKLLFECSILFGIRVHAFVLMPNHFHLLITTPEADLGKVMQYLMQSATWTINSKAGRSGHVFGGRYHWTLVGTPLYFAHALKYVYRNPVKAGICENVESYSYSSLNILLGKDYPGFKCWYPFDLDRYLIVPNDYEAKLKWLNTPFISEHENEIRKNLKKTRFAEPKKGWLKVLRELGEHLV